MSNQTQLPKKDEPLNCAFQRRQDNKIWCALTSQMKYDPCLIDICPMYQTWKLLKTQHESLEML